MRWFFYTKNHNFLIINIFYNPFNVNLTLINCKLLVSYLPLVPKKRIMKERDFKSKKETQGLSFKNIETYVRNYARNYRLSYLRLLSM